MTKISSRQFCPLLPDPPRAESPPPRLSDGDAREASAEEPDELKELPEEDNIPITNTYFSV
ncbi:hypothetical protein GO495_16965 [Chitinophaga oryziterrae]|uniref:Uncharacterized protein n=1 Tax=Chitinophaga oryziterrae TaxID=1031224 RepID=A0A6N8JAH2_9BACT|nr:hypothetical protein [Chitinophaga oryziterrae]MVT42285.1 hypothetical protein [Chitinophaga oryziterrae]